MYNKFVQKITAGFLALVFIFTFFSPVALASARDCDGNAVIYCGTLTKTELKNKLTSGTGKQYQSGSALRSLYSKYGFAMTDIGNLKAGRVTNTNKVYVGDKVVAKNVYTFGRHNIAGSTKVSGLSYPLYRRHPSVSFLSSSIDAYVYMNYDGSMAYAIIKSCGNIVQGVGKRVKPTVTPTPTPTPPPTVTPLEPSASITVQKFHDINFNAVREASEPYLSGWNFRVTGPSYTNTVTTDLTGQARLTGLPQGDYTVTEVAQDGWESTTGLSENHAVTTDPATQTFLFGNYKPITPPETPGTTNTPNPTGGGDIAPTALPVSGLKENLAIGVSLILALALLFYLSSRFYLRKVMKGGHVPTDPAKLVKELRKRTAKRHAELSNSEEISEKKK